MSAQGAKRKRSGKEAKYYAVRVGRCPGIYDNWAQCFEQVKGSKGAVYKSFSTRADASSFLMNRTVLPATGSGKFYAVRRGHATGIFTDWPSAQTQVTGYYKPEHKSFKTREEAEAFLAQEEQTNAEEPPAKKGKLTEDHALLPAGHGLLPPDAEDGFDHTITLDEVTGQIRFKTAEEVKALKAVAREGPASRGEWIKIYTDGACRSNGQRGAIAGVGVWFGANDERNVSERLSGDRQTNQRAELTAVKRALDMCPMNRNAHIFSDSNYAINCVTKWFISWESNGWKTAAGKVVENRDIVEAVLQRIREREACKGKTKFEWVKGHASDVGNIAADSLAVKGSMQAMSDDQAQS